MRFEWRCRESPLLLVAVVSVPASAVREATEHEVLSVREMARA